MSRNAYIMIAVAALVASAFAVLCISDDGFTDASEGYQMPFGPEMSDDQGHGHDMPPMDHRGFDAPRSEPPRYVIDAPERPDGRPERIVDDYGRMFEEKRILEEKGAEVFVFDPELEKDAGRELADVINEVFDGSIVSERPRNAERIAPEELPESYNVSFLEFMMEKTGKDTWIGQMLSVMISQFVSSVNESEGVAPSPGRDNKETEIPSDILCEEEDEKEDVPFVFEISEHTPSSESFLIEHGFDGGTFF